MPLLPSGPRLRRRCLITTDDACAALMLVLVAGNGLQEDDPSLVGFGYYSEFLRWGTVSTHAGLTGLLQRPDIERLWHESELYISCAAGRFWASRLEDPRTPGVPRDVVLHTCCPGLLIEGEMVRGRGCAAVLRPAAEQNASRYLHHLPCAPACLQCLGRTCACRPWRGWTPWCCAP